MRIRLETTEEAMTRREKWRPWFAWFPIYIDNYFVWLETVARREIFTDRWALLSKTEYKFIELQEEKLLETANNPCINSEVVYFKLKNNL